MNLRQNQEDSLSGQMTRRGIRPTYTNDTMPGMESNTPDQGLDQSPYRPGGGFYTGEGANGDSGLIGGMRRPGPRGGLMGGFPPELLAQIQDMYRGGDANGAMQLLTDHVTKNGGGMDPMNPGPRNPQRRARRQKMREDRMARRGAVKPKPVLDKMPAIYDGPDKEMDGDTDDVGAGPVYGNGKPSGRQFETMPNKSEDPNLEYQKAFEKMSTRGNVPAGSGRANVMQPMDKNKLAAYLQQMGMK